MSLFALCLKSCLHLHRATLWKALFLVSNVLTAIIVYFTFFLSNNQVRISIPLYPLSSTTSPTSSSSSSSPHVFTQQQQLPTEIFIYRYTDVGKALLSRSKTNYGDLSFCRLLRDKTATVSSIKTTVSSIKTTVSSNKTTSLLRELLSGDKKIKVPRKKLEAADKEIKILLDKITTDNSQTKKSPSEKLISNDTKSFDAVPESNSRDKTINSKKINSSESISPSHRTTITTTITTPITTLTSTAGTEEYVPFIIAITPTYFRLTQKSDLTFLCQTLMNVPRLIWIVIEDANRTSEQVRSILSRCRVESVLMNVHTTKGSFLSMHRGMDQRNMALDWIRKRCKACDDSGRGVCEGVVYFMDDDNKYDIRLFERIRPTQGLSVFPVGLVGGMRFEGPICKEEKVDRWEVQYAPKRHIPVDMAGFALNVRILVNKPKVKIGYKYLQDKPSTKGYAEPDFLRNLGVTREMAECRGLPDEVLVWHVKTSFKPLIYEKKHPSDPKFKV